MNVSKLKTELILIMYEAIKEALKDDDAVLEGAKKYFVREFKDWKYTADLFESELDKRNVEYDKILW